MTDKAPGWEPDPTGRFDHRYWDGSVWTDHVSRAGVATTDPFAPTSTLAFPNKGRLVGLGLLGAAAVVAAAVLLTRDGSDARGQVRAELAAQINEGGELTSKQASCVADAIIDVVGVDRLEGVDLSSGEPPPADIANDIASAALASIDLCDIDLSQLAGGMEDVAADLGDLGDLGDLDLPDDFGDQLAEIYEDSMGIPGAKARCLAERIVAAMRSGEITENEAMSQFFDYFVDCDIDMRELSGS